jgi:hypothetical protein
MVGDVFARKDSCLPTCSSPLGQLKGLVSAITNKPDFILYLFVFLRDTRNKVLPWRSPLLRTDLKKTLPSRSDGFSGYSLFQNNASSLLMANPYLEGDETGYACYDFS